MFKKQFTQGDADTVLFLETPTALWLADAHDILNEMYGPHPKVCSFALSPDQIVGKEDFLRDVYGYDHPADRRVLCLKGLLNNWYAYYRLSFFKPDGQFAYEIGYKFANDNDAVWFALKAG